MTHGDICMEQLHDILGFILGQAAFDTGRTATTSPSWTTSHIQRPGEVFPANALREVLDDQKWEHQVVKQVRDARLICPEDLLAQLIGHIRFLLEKYIDLETDRMGHAFPIMGSGDTEHTASQDNGLLAVAWTSSVDTFARALIAGAAVIGLEQTTNLMIGWLRGCPVQYRTSALLHGRPVERAATLVEGVNIEVLPHSIDSLPVCLRSDDRVSPHDYVGRAMVSIDCTVAPPLFRPDPDHLKRMVHADTMINLDITTICQGLSLVSNNYIDAGTCWHDYGDLSLFSLNSADTHWRIGPSGLRNRPYASLSLNRNLNTGAIGLVIEEEPRHELNVGAIGQMLNALAALKRQGSHATVFTALSRWMKSKDPYENPVDQFIDLRIAMESLYARSSRSDLRSRVARCGAEHLGTTCNERQDIQKKLRDAYDRASRAVHGSTSVGTRGDLALLSDAQDLCRQSIIKLLQEGPPISCLPE